MIFQFHKSTKNCTLVASQPLFSGLKAFCKRHSAFGWNLQQTTETMKFFFGEKIWHGWKKSSVLNTKEMGRNRHPWVFPFWEFGFFSGSSWLLVYIPESHENLQRIFARPFSRRSKKSSAKLWQLGVGQWQWLTPPPKKKNTSCLFGSQVYIYICVYIYIHISICCLLLFCLFVFMCMSLMKKSWVKCQDDFFFFKKTDVDFVGRKRKQRIIFLDDPWVDFGFRVFLQHREVLLCAPFGTLAMTRMSCWSWNKLPTLIFWLIHYVTPPGLHNRWSSKYFKNRPHSIFIQVSLDYQV